MTYLTILIASRKRLLAHPDLPAFCQIAQQARATFAILCVLSFLGALGVVIGYRMITFNWVPVLLGGLGVSFVFSAILASRFGRLADAEKHPEYRSRIFHLIEISADCANYHHYVAQQVRPFTRLDLDEMGMIYLHRQK